MTRSIRQQAANAPSVIETRDLNKIKAKTGNLYESISIIAKRANQINISVKEELAEKLEEFTTATDSLEEVHENKEQIEISRVFEKIPNASILATEEFMDDKIYFRKDDSDLFE